jgi:hypothetical protein
MTALAPSLRNGQSGVEVDVFEVISAAAAQVMAF